jgi:hypothetical protein
VRAAALAIAVILWQQPSASRVLLATVSSGNRLIVDVGIDDFVIEQGGRAGEVIDVHVADYPLAILIDNSTPTPAEFDAVREAAARFVARIGERGVAAGTLEGTALLTTVEDERPAVLARINSAPAAAGAAKPLDAIASAVRAIQATESPFSAIVVVSARPIDPASLESADSLTPIIESKIPVHVIAHRDSASQRAGEATDVLKEVSNLTHGQYTTIYTAASYAIALDRLADRLATELMIQYLVPPGAGDGGEVRAGVRIPGARVTGLGVSR